MDTPSGPAPSLALDFCGLKFASPIVLLSGCVGFGEEYTRIAGFSNRDAGAIVLKGTTEKPRLGNPPHRVTETPHGMINAIGLQNDQLIPLFTIILVATLVGYLFTATVISPVNGPRLHLAALILIAAGSWMDAQVTNLTRPEQFYVSQAMIAFAGAMFLPPALLVGFGKAIVRGPMGILSFLVVFLGTQSMGGILASAILGTFQTIREKFHSSVIVEHLTLQDPLVAQRIRTYGAAYSKVLPDPALQNAEGVVALGRVASQEASILAYQDMFLLIFYVALAGMVLLAAHTFYVRYRTARLAALNPA